MILLNRFGSLVILHRNNFYRLTSPLDSTPIVHQLIFRLSRSRVPSTKTTYRRRLGCFRGRKVHRLLAHQIFLLAFLTSYRLSPSPFLIFLHRKYTKSSLKLRNDLATSIQLNYLSQSLEQLYIHSLQKRSHITLLN